MVLHTEKGEYIALQASLALRLSDPVEKLMWILHTWRGAELYGNLSPYPSHCYGETLVYITH